MIDFLASPNIGVPRHVWLALPLELRYHTPAADLYRRQARSSRVGHPVILPSDSLKRHSHRHFPTPSILSPRLPPICITAYVATPHNRSNGEPFPTHPQLWAMLRGGLAEDALPCDLRRVPPPSAGADARPARPFSEV